MESELKQKSKESREREEFVKKLVATAKEFGVPIKVVGDKIEIKIEDLEQFKHLL